MPLLIRQPLTDTAEREAILAVHRAAFGRNDEAGLVEQLYAAGRNAFERVAEQDGDIIAHVLFSPIHIEHGDDGRVLGLAPMAVAPDWQRCGVGTQLVQDALQALSTSPFRSIVVLGDQAYYQRFGFVPASSYDLHDSYGGGDAFMALALHEGALDGYRGQVDYAPEFANLSD
jgi:putative acetyltransferase